MHGFVRLPLSLAIASLLAVFAPAASGASTNPAPFIVSASSGPAAGSRVGATVTRSVGGTNVTLPAALVPALAPGDVVDVDATDYRRPPSSVNYHVNVAFITETARQHWLFERSGPADQLFSNDRRRTRGVSAKAGRIHFVYGTAQRSGIPIFFIIPEDAKTRGVNGVRDYIGAHPTDFVDMSQSTNNAVDQYSFLRDFLSSLGSGAIDITGARDRIETLAQSVGVSPASIDACYTLGGTPAAVQNCIQQAVNAVVYQTNFSAPTQAQFLGGIAGAASPATYAPYISSLLTVWRLFVQTGHIEYEYLPTSIELADPSTRKRDELLMGPKVPTVRPPAAASDVLFFTIGDPQATEHAPVIINGAPANGICERTARYSIPVHFDHTSRYVHDAFLSVTPDGRAPYSLPLDPRSLDAPVVNRSQLHDSVDGGYTISLNGQFGFDAVQQPQQVAARVVLPSGAPWAIAAQPHHPPIAGSSLDLIATSPAVPCLSRAELQIGSAPPISLTATALDAQRVELRAPLTGVPAGPAVIRFYQDDPLAAQQIETTSHLVVESPPALVDLSSAVASLGDRFLNLTGSALDTIRGVLLDGMSYTKSPGGSAVAACFTGPPLAGPRLAVGRKVTAQLVPGDARAGEVFPVTIAAQRPALTSALVLPASSATRLSTQSVTLRLASDAQPMPHRFSVRIRQANEQDATPCDGVRADQTAVTVPTANVHTLAANAISLDLHPDLLGDRAFGALQAQVVDTDTGLGSSWQSIPATFARAPAVTQIACPHDAGDRCRMYGSGLAAIEAVQNRDGTFVPPDIDCPPTDKGIACVWVPRAPHYQLRLIDGGTLESLPDSLIPPAP